jgi:hypothetical protein
MNAPEHQTNAPIVPFRPTTASATSMVPTDMTAAMRLAEMMATGKLVPAHLQKSPGDCLMVVELAMRFNMSPFAVAQCTSVIQGKLMLEGKLVAAAINASGALARRLSYSFTGVNDTREVTVRGTLRGEKEPREITVSLREAQTTNPLWKRQPDQQLVYFGTRAWARRHAPEIMLGVYSGEEFDRDTLMGITLDAEPEPTRREEPQQPTVEPPPAPKRQTTGEWLDELALECAACDGPGLEEILSRDRVQQAQDRLTGNARDKLNHIIHEALKRTAEPRDAPDEADPFLLDEQPATT